MISLRDQQVALHINPHAELRALQVDNWIDKDKILTPKAKLLLEQVECYFCVQKKKVSKILGDDAETMMVTYLELFPKIKLPSGKQARADIKNVETAFQWFFANYKYSWETILEATLRYTDEFQLKGYLYMQTSQYFIRKQQSDKSWGSELANWCASIEAGPDESSKHFSESVV